MFILAFPRSKLKLTLFPYEALFCSKEGAAQVRLKIGLVSDDAGHNFTFTSPQAVAVTERERFKGELTNIISRNRSGVATPTVPAPITPSATQAPTGVPSPRPPLAISRPSTSRAPSVASDSRTTGTPVNDPTSDYRLLKKVLVSNTELAALHRELVMGGHITENEFWEGREVIFQHFPPYQTANNTTQSILFLRNPQQKVRRRVNQGNWWIRSRKQSTERLKSS